MACFKAGMQSYSKVNEANIVKNRQKTGKVSRWRALKAILESLALNLLAMASSLEVLSRVGLNMNRIFWKKAPREETEEKGHIPQHRSNL